MVLPAAAAMPVPAGWTAEQALGLVVNWPTALAALKPLGRIAAGETVLIHAAAGATGQAAVTMAKHYGATVIATASPSKHETVLALGADHVLDSRDGDLAAEVLRLTGGAGADLVLESAGGATFHASLAAAKPVTGRVVVYGVAGGEAAITNWELVYTAPGPRHRPQHRRADPGRTPDLRRAHGRAVRPHRRRRPHARSAHRLRPGRRPEGPRGTGSQDDRRQTALRPDQPRDRPDRPADAKAWTEHGSDRACSRAMAADATTGRGRPGDRTAA